MTDPAYQVPDLTIVDPTPGAVRNGQCAPDAFGNNHHNHNNQQQQQQQQHVKSPVQHEALTSGQEMKITDNVEGEGTRALSFTSPVWGGGEGGDLIAPHRSPPYLGKWAEVFLSLL